MHLALRRYAEPTRDVFAYFWLGVVGTVAVLAGIAERLDEIEERMTVAAVVHHSNRQIAEATATVHAYAYDAFPSWVADHPDRACPAGPQELTAYIAGSAFDPWGTAYKVACDERGRLVAWSFGPDGVFQTADDVRSR